MKLEAWSDSNIGLVRKSNQDTVGCFPELSLFVVADGMGGRADGAIASRMAVAAIRDALSGNLAVGRDTPKSIASDQPSFWRTLFGRRAPPDDTPANAALDLRDAVLLANQRIYASTPEGAEAWARGTMGTTVVALTCDLAARRARWAHVGDSRLYRARDRELRLLTADHTLFGEAYWSEPTVPSDLPHTNRLVRAVGLKPALEVALGQDDLHAGDLFLLCSDGVSAMVRPQELRDTLVDAVRLADAGHSLIKCALAAGGKDNASALLVRVTES